MKIGPGVSELWGVENRPLPLTRPMAYTTACTTVQAVMDATRVASLTQFTGASNQLKTHVNRMLYMQDTHVHHAKSI